ncbi:DUF2993 domain-containing protein [Streptomyces pathocidini]|uniref:DUF2993 domain-containing protein n=1 Tax=Streptomyces pathocidini TaxID=1650571 RepID=A0ABW7UWT6_9ACTN|nr:DUF2993 domain-containing protein [Streptomyces pathocidini]
MRAARILLILVVVLGGLFVAADRLLVGLVEDEAAEKIRTGQGLDGTPDVSIKGFPFLTQVAGENLDQVDINLDGATAGAGGSSIRFDRLRAQLHDVRLENNFSTATAERATGSAHFSYEDLSKAATDGVTIGYGGKDAEGRGRVKATARLELPILDQAYERSLVATLSVANGNTIRLRADDIPGLGIPGLEKLIRARVDFDRPLGGLPEGLKLEKVTATKDGVDVSVSGTQVKLAG